MPRQRHIRKRGQGRGCRARGADEGAHQDNKQPVPESVIAAMDAALADERSAVSNYQVVLDRFGPVRPFVNIAGAEKRHIGALLNLYDSLDIPVPENVVEADPIFATADLRTLCRLSVDGEIENVRLYDEELLPAVSGYSNISAVMKRLRDASELRHKPAFERCVKRYADS